MKPYAYLLLKYINLSECSMYTLSWYECARACLWVSGVSMDALEWVFARDHVN